MEALSKIIDLIGKYAWAVFFTACFVLFIPADTAERIGILALRNTHKDVGWIVLVLASALWLAAAFRYLDRRVFDEWLRGRREARTAEELRREMIESLALRLRSLNPREQMWIKYCLFCNVQTLSASGNNLTANSLENKGIVQQGTGHSIDLPFHIPDLVWQYLLKHKDEFLPVHQRTKAFHAELVSFHKSLVT